MPGDTETTAPPANGDFHDADPNGTTTSTISHGDNNDSDPGFGAVAAGVEELTTTAQERMGITSHGGKEKPKTVTKLKYSLAFQLTAHVETEWLVVEGFTLRGIRLDLDAEMSSNNDGEFFPLTCGPKLITCILGKRTDKGGKQPLCVLRSPRTAPLGILSFSFQQR